MTKKKIFILSLAFLFLVLVLVFLFTACREKTYVFKQPIDKIASVEIVSAKNSLEFSVIKELSQAEKNDFIERFQAVNFQNYLIGDPMSVSGNAVKISYQNGDYEMICHYWSEYVKNGEVYFIRKSCDENEYNELLNDFLI